MRDSSSLFDDTVVILSQDQLRQVCHSVQYNIHTVQYITWYIIPYSTIQHMVRHTIQYNTTHGTSYHTVQYITWYIIPYSTIQHMVHHTIQYNTSHGTSYHTIQYITCYIIPYSTIQQCSTIRTLLVECQHTKQESAHVTR